MCRGHGQYPAFAPDFPFSLQDPQKWPLGFFRLSVSSGPELPLLHVRAVIFSPRQSLCILKLDKRCAQLQALQQRVPGPSLAQLD